MEKVRFGDMAGCVSSWPPDDFTGRKVRFSSPWGWEEGIVEADRGGMLDIVTEDETLFVVKRGEVRPCL